MNLGCLFMKETKIQYLLTQVEVLEFGYQVGHWENPTIFDEWFGKSLVQPK